MPKGDLLDLLWPVSIRLPPAAHVAGIVPDQHSGLDKLIAREIGSALRERGGIF